MIVGMSNRSVGPGNDSRSESARSSELLGFAPEARVLIVNCVRALVRSGHLRKGLASAAAADIVYALMSPEVFRIFTVERGWSEARYERWLAAALRVQL